MKASSILIGVGLGGAAIGLGMFLYRSASPLGYYQAGRMKRPRLVDTKYADGMTTKTYESKNMSIQERIGLIQEKVEESVKDPRMRRLALQMTANCPARDGQCEAKAIYEAVRQRVRYTGDVAEIKQKNGRTEGIDFYQSAWRTWDFRGEDCDGHAILVSTLLALNGIVPKLRVTSPTRQNDWQHIYVVAGLPKERPTKWIALDTTLPGRRFMVEAPYRKNIDFDA